MVRKVFNLNDHRKENKSIDLISAFKEKYNFVNLTDDEKSKVENFLCGIDLIYEIVSRQVAALCLVQAAVYAGIDEHLL